MTLIRVESPCNSTCRQDSRGVCIGCGRSRDEITRWKVMSPREQLEVLDLAHARLERINMQRYGSAQGAPQGAAGGAKPPPENRTPGQTADDQSEDERGQDQDQD